MTPLTQRDHAKKQEGKRCSKKQCSRNFCGAPGGRDARVWSVSGRRRKTTTKGMSIFSLLLPLLLLVVLPIFRPSFLLLSSVLHLLRVAGDAKVDHSDRGERKEFLFIPRSALPARNVLINLRTGEWIELTPPFY